MMLQDGVRLPKAKVRGSNPLGCANNFNVLGAVCVRQRVWNSREPDVNDSSTVVAVWHTADTTANDAARARNSASLQAADEKRSATQRLRPDNSRAWARIATRTASDLSNSGECAR